MKTKCNLNNNYGNEKVETLNNNKERNKEIVAALYLTLLLSLLVFFLATDNDEVKTTNIEKCFFSEKVSKIVDLENNYSNINC